MRTSPRIVAGTLVVLVGVGFLLARTVETPGTEPTRVVRSVWEPNSSAHVSRSRPRSIAGVSYAESGASVVVVDELGTARVSLGLREVGRRGSHTPLANGPRESTANGARYRRGGLDEWFRRTEQGLEHGMTLFERSSGEGVLELVVAFDGLSPVLNGTDVVLHDDSFAPRVAYENLVVTDASGARMPSAMAVVGGSVVLRIDDSHASYPVTVDPIVTTTQTSLSASDGAANDEFGGTPFGTSGGPSVAISGSLAAVAAPFDDDPSGGVYVYQRAGAVWTQIQKITPPVAIGTGARFGYSIALAGTRLVVGAPLGFGRAAVYSFSAGSFSLDTVLSDTTGEQFGCAVAVSGNRVAVGARYDDRGTPGGSASVFQMSGSIATLESRVKASDQASLDDFGTQVALDDSTNTLAVTSIFATGASTRGAVYIFNGPSTWTQAQKLVASDAASLDQFGRSLALLGTRLVVGAPQNQVTVFNQGAAYVFDRVGPTFTETTRLVASDAQSDDQFGYSVALSTDLVLVGARFADTPGKTDSGAVYSYRWDGGAWIEPEKSVAATVAANDRYGDSVAISGTDAIVGAPFHDFAGSNFGVAYLTTIVVTKQNGESCGGATECVTGNCVDGVCCATTCTGGTTDCQACSIAGGGSTNGTCTALRAGVAPNVTCRPSSGVCDPSETCLSTSTACPPDLFVPDGSGCPSDGAVCNGSESCQSGACASPGLSCDDVDACTADACSEPGGCTHSAVSCDDNDVCTSDSCNAATGCAHSAVSCDDGDACTADTCDALAGCGHSTVSCDDGNPCTADSCSAIGGCAHTAVSCDDGNACTADSCDLLAGCLNAVVSCDDGDACTADSCDAITGCGHGVVSCDDNDVCTADSCDAITGCGHGAVSCDDNDACTADTCDAITGCGHGTVSCDDNDACTADSCDAITGCAHGTVSCDDGDACTADSCDAISGCGHGTVSCDDNDACTSDACAPASGCTHGAISCDDSSVCTTDTCDALAGCQNTAVGCDDGDACTAESCDAVTGCGYTTVSCNDYDACTADTCDSVSGCAHSAVTCDDGLSCTTDTCASATGCVYTPDVCDDADACTADSCTAGGCGYTAVDCDDNDVCTSDSCNTATGCGHASVSCDDGDVCTADSCDALAGCGHAPIGACCTSSAQCDDGSSCTDDSCNGSNTCDFVDNGTCPDAGVDAGTSGDSGVSTDSGTPTDSGTTADSGANGDGGVDAGTDAGIFGGVRGGCGCAVAGRSSDPSLGGLFALALAGVVAARTHARRRR